MEWTEKMKCGPNRWPGCEAPELDLRVISQVERIQDHSRPESPFIRIPREPVVGINGGEKAGISVENAGFFADDLLSGTYIRPRVRQTKDFNGNAFCVSFCPEKATLEYCPYLAPAFQTFL